MEGNTTTQQTSELEYVGFWARFGAAFLDGILMCLITVPLSIAVYGSGYWSSERMVTGPADLMISYVLPAVVVILFWVNKSATPGKMGIRARIVDARTGGRPGIGQFVIRYIGYFISALPLCLGYLRAGFDPRKQAWHDKMAGTVVVRARSPEQVRFEQPSREPAA